MDRMEENVRMTKESARANGAHEYGRIMGWIISIIFISSGEPGGGWFGSIIPRP